MKRIKTVILIMFLMFITFTLNVKADSCTDQEKADLLEKASKVTSNYKLEDIKTKEVFVDPDTHEEFEEDVVTQKFVVSIYNITNDLYVKITEGETGEVKYIEYSNTKDGTYTYETNELDNIVVYNYEVYSNNEKCSGEVLKTLVFTKPKRNPNAQFGICEGLEDHPSCKKYVTEDVPFNEDELYKAREKKSSVKGTEKNKEEKEGITSFFKNNYIYIIAGVVVITTAAVVIVVIKRKRSAL